VLSALGQVVVMLHKPAGFVTATEDAYERTVMELLPPSMKHWDLKPIGRLDKETEGLLLFTNDGDLLHRLITPSKGVKKVYIACHEGLATQEDAAAFQEGITLKDGTICRPATLEILEPGKCRVTVEEGKYHQVRRMLASRGFPVTYLKRIEEGGLSLGDLPLGEVRQLTKEEISAL
jgi:16S rRNA pseudouridine516 synthase